MLPDIIISSSVSGITHLNDRVLGEVNSDTYQSFIGAGTFYLSFSPLDYSQIFAPFSVRISIINGIPEFSCPYVNLITYGRGAFYLEICPPIVAGNTLPHCQSFERIHDRFVISLMEQCGHYLVIEDEKRSLPDGFFQLELSGKKPNMQVVRIESGYYIMVYDNVEHLYILSQNGESFTLSHSLEADVVEVDDKAITASKTTKFGHVVNNVYKQSEGVLSLFESTYKDGGAVLSTDDIPMDFLECIKYGIESRAMDYLAPDLDLSFEELREFLGSFSQIKSSPFESDSFALITKTNGANIAARFSFEITGSKINNIQEL